MTCIPLERLRRFRRQQLAEEERKLVERHLSECRTCRRLLVDDLRRDEASGPETIPDEILERVRGLVEQRPVHRRTSRRTWLPLAAVVIALVGAWWLYPRPGADRVLRDVDPVSGRLAPVEPAAAVEVAGRVHFRWTPVQEASLYRLVLLGDDGARLLERETEATEIEVDVGELAVDESVGLEVYWMVEAQLPGGGRLHSDPRPIRVAASTGPPP